jgi:rhodanese-related sulfurtransferase
MKARSIFSIIIIALGSVAAIIPQKRNDSIERNERQMLTEMLLESNYISADELAHLLIEGDPAIRIIDVRSVDEFKDPLPRALNVPLDSIFSENYAYLFDQRTMKNVLYAENDQKAVQVWMLTKQQGFDNNYLLKGGLEAWDQTIIDPPVPSQAASGAEHALYQKRLAAKQFFTGTKAIPQTNFEPIAPIKSKKKKRVQGGCS